MLNALTTFPRRFWKEKEYKKAIATAKDSFDRTKAEYDFLQYLIEEFSHNHLLLAEQRKLLLPRVKCLYQIGAEGRFYRIINELRHLEKEWQYKLVRAVECANKNDYVEAKSLLLQAWKRHRRISDEQKQKVLTNLIVTNYIQNNADENEIYFSEIETLIYDKNYVVGKGLELLMWGYEDGGKEGKMLKLIDHIKQNRYNTWADFLECTWVLYNHYRRIFDLENQQDVVRHIEKTAVAFELSEEERLSFEIRLLRLYFESKMGEFEPYSIKMIDDCQRYLDFNAEIAFTFAEEIVDIIEKSGIIRKRFLNHTVKEKFYKGILTQLQPYVRENDFKMAQLSDDFIFQKAAWRNRKAFFMRLNGSLLKESPLKFQLEIVDIHLRTHALCKAAENDSECLNYSIQIADEMISLSNLLDVREFVKVMADEAKEIIEKHKNPVYKYNLLRLAKIYDFLGNQPVIRNLIKQYNEVGVEHIVYTEENQNIYCELERKYQMKTPNMNLRMRNVISDLINKNYSNEIKEALSIAGEKMKELALDGETIPFGIRRETLLRFIYMCGLTQLNGEQPESAIQMVELFNRYSRNADPSLRTNVMMILTKAYVQKGDYEHADGIIKQLLADSDLSDRSRLEILLLRANSRLEQPDFDSKIDAMADALNVAERIDDPKLIADVYQKLSVVVSSQFPALGLSILRRAATYYLKNKNEYGVLSTNLLIAQTCLNIHLAWRKHYGTKTKCFLKEAQQILSTTPRDLLIHDSDRDLYNNVFKKANEKLNHAYKIMRDQEQEDGIPFPVLRVSSEPTLLHVLDRISFEEEQFFLKSSYYGKILHNPNNEGKCIAVTNADGTVSLSPQCRMPFRYYRGQTYRFSPCKPSLYRGNMSQSKQYLERVRYAEFRLLIDTHPICGKYSNSIKLPFPDGEKTVPFKIYHLALAQHYGIATELIDVTSDKWVAAFFAATDCVDGKYRIHTDTSDNGVFYVCADLAMTKVENPIGVEPSVKPIGIQPFSRPGEQRGYAYPISSEEDFEGKSEIITFSHSAAVNKLIFYFTNQSKRLFPNDILEEKANKVKGSLTFSKKAYEVAQQEFYPKMPAKQFFGWGKEQNMRKQKAPIVAFTQEEIADFEKNYPAFEKSLYENIITPVYAFRQGGASSNAQILLLKF